MEPIEDKSDKENGGKLTINKYRNAIIDKYYRTRGDMDQCDTQIYTVYPRTFDDRRLTTA